MSDTRLAHQLFVPRGSTFRTRILASACAAPGSLLDALTADRACILVVSLGRARNSRIIQLRTTNQPRRHLLVFTFGLLILVHDEHRDASR